ncbi:MAG: tRNA (adenosine(37)-N6)-threonylcarbamoyltransferase complex dimerization subunit type 1 TsaB [Bacteroidales bacterium]|nr:tRNA (adenosine(37)-N6)-threonylcarbamoyltransferase complex dimerization subunit type 1 TsaB [Bacteroidales bacterium]
MNPVILHIETSTEVCSVAISQKKELIFYKESPHEMSHSSSLAVLIDEGLKTCKLNASGLNAVSVSQGPGSYTGLRIGVSTAKGLCYGAGIPLIAIPTLLVMTKKMVSDKDITFEKNSLFCPMIDARRMEVYTALYDSKLNLIENVKAEIITETSFNLLLNKHNIYFFGNGAEKCKMVIKNKNAVFIDTIYPSADSMPAIAFEKFEDKAFEDVAYFEPFYLKDFIATIPKKNIYK